jgi:hypothetical protein
MTIAQECTLFYQAAESMMMPEKSSVPTNIISVRRPGVMSKMWRSGLQLWKRSSCSAMTDSYSSAFQSASECLVVKLQKSLVHERQLTMTSQKMMQTMSQMHGRAQKGQPTKKDAT